MTIKLQVQVYLLFLMDMFIIFQQNLGILLTGDLMVDGEIQTQELQVILL